MHFSYQRLLPLCLAALLSAFQPGLAAAVENKPEPIHIEADRMESYQQRDEVLFSGNVEARQGDIIIRADEMTVTYLQTDKEKPADSLTQKADKIFSRGNVKIVSKDWTATGDAMEYFSKNREMILHGNAKAWQDNNLVTGETIRLYLDEGKSVVEKGGKNGKRVKAFIYPEENSKPGENGQ